MFSFLSISDCIRSSQNKGKFRLERQFIVGQSPLGVQSQSVRSVKRNGM